MRLRFHLQEGSGGEGLRGTRDRNLLAVPLLVLLRLDSPWCARTFVIVHEHDGKSTDRLAPFLGVETCGEVPLALVDFDCIRPLANATVKLKRRILHLLRSRSDVGLDQINQLL